MVGGPGSICLCCRRRFRFIPERFPAKPFVGVAFGGEGLLPVTVVGRDAASAEVWSKALFVAGRGAITAMAKRKSIAALWIEDQGRVFTSSAMERYVKWRRE